MAETRGTKTGVKIGCYKCNKTMFLDYSVYLELEGREDLFCSNECVSFYYPDTITKD